jgi:hypothetical protein
MYLLCFCIFSYGQQCALIVPFLYSMYWLLHVSAAACHHQGAYYIHLTYLKFKSNGWYAI